MALKKNVEFSIRFGAFDGFNLPRRFRNITNKEFVVCVHQKNMSPSKLVGIERKQHPVSDH